jgi:hypothetical protein
MYYALRPRSNGSCDALPAPISSVTAPRRADRRIFMTEAIDPAELVGEDVS